MATLFRILAWLMPRTEEPGGLQSMGLKRVEHDLATEHARIFSTTWRTIQHLRIDYRFSFWISCLMLLRVAVQFGNSSRPQIMHLREYTSNSYSSTPEK